VGWSRIKGELEGRSEGFWARWGILMYSQKICVEGSLFYYWQTEKCKEKV
jgi:hypothetical protein